MVQSQARLSLSKRNWSKNTSKYSIPISQFCVLVLILQIGSIAYISVRGTQKSIRVGRKLFDLRRTPPLRSKVLTGPDPFLPKNVKLASLENHIHAESHKKVKACRWYQRNVHGKVRVVHEDGCERPNQKFIVYNPLNHDRFICNGTVVVQAEGFTLVINKDCDDGMTKSRLFGITPTLENAKKMPPITIGNVGAEDSPDVEDFPCDVGCRKHAATEENVNELSILGTPWTVQYSMESAAHYPQLKFDTTAHRYNLFYATTSFDSEIPLPYFSWAEYSIQTPPVEFEKGIKGASFVASNCHSLSNRELVVEELMKLMRVDALGSCLQNALPPPGAVLNDSASLKRQYLFHLAFENSIEHDYVTEKLWDTLRSGTLPIYMGAPNIWHHAPPKSIISWHDFGSTQELANYLTVLANNRTLYESYHAWRKEPLPTFFREKYEFTNVHSACRICRWAYARKYGHTFNHVSQTMRPPIIPREPCWDVATQLLSYPIRELWLQASKVLLAASENYTACQRREAAHSTTNVGTWTRSVTSSDSVLDIEIEGRGEDGLYQLGLPVHGPAYEVSPRHWLVQGKSSRIILLTSWDAHLQTGTLSQGVANIEMRGQKLMKLRVFIENVDAFYPDGDEEPSYFGNLMVKDFENPVEKFLIIE